MHLKIVVAFLALITCTHYCHAEDISAYKKKMFIHGKDTLRYRILYPESYNKHKSYPLVVFLHGAGERGNDNERQLDHGGTLFLTDSIRKKFPAIVIFPQCPVDSLWKVSCPLDLNPAYDPALNTSGPTTPERLVKLLMDNLVERNIADNKRIYICGLSMGGFGVYDLVIHYPHYFAAAIAICGKANVKLYPEKAASVPLWIFHGEADNVVPVQPDRDLYKALQIAGAKNVKYTEYPGVYHNSWENAFAEPTLLTWLFSFSK